MKKALLLLGGPSGRGFEELREEIKPDLVMGANGTNVHPLDIWLCTERMNYASQQADKGVQRYIDILEMFQRTTPKKRIVNVNALHLLKDKTNVQPITRVMVNSDSLSEFTFRKPLENTMGVDGLLKGDMFKRKEHMKGTGHICVGTVAFQMLHMAGILGVDEIHTIGLDMCFRDVHHWYKYPPYEEGKFFRQSMFTEYEDLKTMWIWIESAEYVQKMLPVMERDGITWKDHSNGLLQKMGVL